MSVDLSALPPDIAEAAGDLEKKIAFESLNEKGANGYVLLGINRVLDRKVAVKFYYWGDGAHPEPKKLNSLASTNVLRVEDAAAINKDYAYFVTPFCDGGDLDDVLERAGIGVIQALDYLQQIANGASFIHGKGYIHRDLKPSNIFCEGSGKLLIGDFGSVVKIGDQGYAKTDSTHSLIYRTPEEIATNRAYPTGDVYQLGIILYQLLGGCLSYNLQDWLKPNEQNTYNSMPAPDNELYADEKVKNLISKGKVLNLNTLPAWCPEQLVRVIRKCTKVNCDQRYESISALKAALSNLRASLPDWRVEPELVLYRSKAKFRVVKSDNLFLIKKMVKNGNSWRRVNAVKPASLAHVIKAAEKL